MAEENKYSVRSAVNYDVSGGWTVQSAIDISSQTHGSQTLRKDTRRIGVYADSAVYFRFDRQTTDTISTSNDLIIPGQTLTFIRVPEALKTARDDQITFHCKQVTSTATESCRIVEV